MKSSTELPEWSQALRSARKSLNVSRTSISEQSGIPAATIRSYEDGARHPTREHLLGLLDALRITRIERDEILVKAGFAPDGYYLGPAVAPGYMFTQEEAETYISKMAWPVFFVDDALQVMAANAVAQRLWGIDLLRDFPNPYDRNIMSVATLPKFADRVLNWEEMLQVGISIFKGHHLGSESLDAPSPSFGAILERFLSGDPQRVGRLVTLWQQTEPRSPKVRWEYPVVWKEGDDILRFLAVVTTANEPKGLSFNDWIPLDAETWAALGRLAGASERLEGSG